MNREKGLICVVIFSLFLLGIGIYMVAGLGNTPLGIGEPQRLLMSNNTPELGETIKLTMTGLTEGQNCEFYLDNCYIMTVKAHDGQAVLLHQINTVGSFTFTAVIK